jgi:hypothetical protein
MIKVKTSEAKGLQLDWGLLSAANKNPRRFSCHIVEPYGDSHRIYSHTDPVVCMGLIKKLSIYGVSLADFSSADSGSVEFCCEADFKSHSGDTLEQAVARCFLEMVLGKVFEVPDELGVTK